MKKSRPPQMTRREFVGRTAGAAAGLYATRASANAPERPPNIVYAFSDEHRWHSMAFTESPGVKTPNMDRVAAEGVSFTDCISNYPVCSPHRAILMTGRWPYQQGIVDNGIALRKDDTTLGKTFKEAGYATGYVGKWHLGGTRAEPFGFDHSLIWDNTNAHWDKSCCYPAKGKPVTPKGYNATLMTDQALEFIGARRADPFFLMVSWNPPHSDFLDAPESKKALYPEGSLPQRANAEDKTVANRGKADKIWGQNTWPHYRGYHAHVSAIDDELGRILAHLEKLGLAENTIVVYSSDHGSMLGSHGVGGKRQPYEESIRVPFLAWCPGRLAQRRVVDALFGTVDIMPTLCALAGIPVPGSCVGEDFSRWLRGGNGPDPEDQLIMHIAKENASGGNEHPAPLFRGLRTRDHTYAVCSDGHGLLFDNRRDPFQRENLFDDERRAKVRTEFESRLRERLRAAEDPFVVPEKA